MKNELELLGDHKEISSEIAFLKKEIAFLLKLLKNAYSASVNIGKIKLLDGYWNGFEENIIGLDFLLTKINKEESHLTSLFPGELFDVEKSFLKREKIISEFYSINKAVKGIKESFYGYMDGCCGCCYKNSNN